MICIPIVAPDTESALKKMALAELLADVIEIRLDLMETWDVHELIASAARPVLITYRSKREGGGGSADYDSRIRLLSRAVAAGAAYVDVEFRIPLEYRKAIIESRGASEIILSLHLRNGTPSPEKLERLFRKMTATGADILKIITWARTSEDNLRVLNLITRGRALGIRVIAFCMGPMGRISRIAAPLLGGFMTFASLGAHEESASGQIPASQMREMLEILSS